MLDPESQEARVDDALHIDTFDPLGNADVGIVDGFDDEKHAEFDQVCVCMCVCLCVLCVYLCLICDMCVCVCDVCVCV